MMGVIIGNRNRFFARHQEVGKELIVIFGGSRLFLSRGRKFISYFLSRDNNLHGSQ